MPISEPAKTLTVSLIQGLQAALDAKSPIDHTHAIALIEGLQSALDNKLDITAKGIITSAAQPSSPINGLIWNELNSDGDLIESWTRINNSWLSAIKEISLSSPSIGSTTTYSFPVDSSKNVYFLSYISCFICAGTTSPTNYWTVTATAYNGANAISPALFQDLYQNQTIGQVITATKTIKKVLNNISNFRLTVGKTGTPVNSPFSFIVRYQSIRT